VTNCVGQNCWQEGHAGNTVSVCVVLLSSSHCKNGRSFGQAKAVLKTKRSTEYGSDKQWKTHAASRLLQMTKGQKKITRSFQMNCTLEKIGCVVTP